MMNKKFEPDKLVEPKWLKEVNPNSTLNVREMAKLFNISVGTVYNYYLQGKLPKPDIERGYTFGKPENLLMGNRVKTTQKLYWRVGTVIKFIRQSKEKRDAGS